MNNKKNYYAIIPANVRYDKRLSPLTRLIYGEITALTNEKGYCFATNAYFANLYSMSNVSISRCISELKEHNYIRVVYDIKEKNVDKRKIYINNLENKKLENEEIKNNEELKNKEINTNIEEYKENESINKNNNTNKNDDAFSLAKIKLANRIKLNDDTDLSNNIKEHNQNCFEGISFFVLQINVVIKSFFFCHSERNCRVLLFHSKFSFVIFITCKGGAKIVFCISSKCRCINFF